jgi:predicted nucleic acid-binding protein
MDGHLAALAIEHGATLYTNDKDFARFSGVRVRNPLQ